MGQPRKSMSVVAEVEIFERVPLSVELWTLQKKTSYAE